MTKKTNADLVREKELLGKAMGVAAEDEDRITEEVVRQALEANRRRLNGTGNASKAEDSKPAERIKSGRGVWSRKGDITIDVVDNLPFLSEVEVRAAFRTLSRLSEAMGYSHPEFLKVRILSMPELVKLAGSILKDPLGVRGHVPIALYLYGVVMDGFPTGTELVFSHDYLFLARNLLIRNLVHEYCHMMKALNRDEGYADEDAAKMWEEMLTPAVEMAMDEARRAMLALEHSLFDAAQKGYADEVRCLLGMGVDPNAGSYTALEVAKDYRHAKVVQILKEAGAVDLEELYNTFFNVAASGGNEDLMRNLLDRGINVNASSCYGCTALMYAAENGHSNVVRFLISKDADINAEERLCQT